MIGPIARWAIKKAVSLTENAIRDSVRASEKAYREAEIKKEEDREAADPAYRAYKDAIREDARIAEEKHQRLREIEAEKQARFNRSSNFLWKASKWTYLICVLSGLFHVNINHYIICNSYLWDIQMRYDEHVRVGGSLMGSLMYHEFVTPTLFAVWVLVTVIWAGNELREPDKGYGKVLGLVPRILFGYIFVRILLALYF